MDSRKDIVGRLLEKSHHLSRTARFFVDYVIFGSLIILWITSLSFLISSSKNPAIENQELLFQSFANKSQDGGPYRVMKSTIFVGGFICGGNQNAIIYSPIHRLGHERSRKFPLISFGHGLGAGGLKLDRDYSHLLVGIASWGFIVVAPESAPRRYCPELYQDQLRVFDYVETEGAYNRAFDLLNISSPYGLLGHSMGGRSTIICATKDRNIEAAAALHPVYTQAVSKVKSPILYGTGTEDIFVPPSSVKQSYEETPSTVDKIYVNILGATHYEPGRLGQGFWPDFLAAFFTCHLVNQHVMDSPACQRVYGNHSETCDMCHCPTKIPVESCKMNH